MPRQSPVWFQLLSNSKPLRFKGNKVNKMGNMGKIRRIGKRGKREKNELVSVQHKVGATLKNKKN